MSIIKTTDDIKRLGTILCVWAHPDDETFTMAGIIAAAIKNGQKVICVTATCGEKGVEDESRWPAEHLAEIRKAELKNALKELGVTEHHVLNYPDGGCSETNNQEAVSRITEFIKNNHPNSIMTFGSDGLTGHEDHKTVSGWVGQALMKSGETAQIYHAALSPGQREGFAKTDEKLNFFFNTKYPPICEESQAAICINLDDYLFARKIQALKAHESQYTKMFELFDGQLRPAFGTEVFARAW